MTQFDPILNSTPIAAGDVVRLKSGGPMMTVSSVAERNEKMTAWCDWFVNDEHKSNAFRVVQLTKTDPLDFSAL